VNGIPKSQVDCSFSKKPGQPKLEKHSKDGKVFDYEMWYYPNEVLATKLIPLILLVIHGITEVL
jgi:hypothetical protein